MTYKVDLAQRVLDIATSWSRFKKQTEADRSVIFPIQESDSPVSMALMIVNTFNETESHIDFWGKGGLRSDLRSKGFKPCFLQLNKQTGLVEFVIG